MAVNNYTTEQLVERVMLTLPSKFTREDTSNVYAFFYGICEALKINTDHIDELFLTTTLKGATGQYLDDYIYSLSQIGRKSGETDDEYRQRYYNMIFKYNCTTQGIKDVIIDVTGTEPVAMYSYKKHGGFVETGYNFYNDTSAISTYGDDTSFIGFIQLSQAPTTDQLEELCKTINSVKASGIRIWLYWR